eukprot:8312960-Pyramimonas_sp.AAC.1
MFTRRRHASAILFSLTRLQFRSPTSPRGSRDPSEGGTSQSGNPRTGLPQGPRVSPAGGPEPLSCVHILRPSETLKAVLTLKALLPFVVVTHLSYSSDTTTSTSATPAPTAARRNVVGAPKRTYSAPPLTCGADGKG